MSLRFRFLALAALVCAATALASTPDTLAIRYRADAIFNASSGNFAPYMQGSWNGGIVTAKNDALIDLQAHRDIDLSRRFSWGAGIEAVAGYAHKAPYIHYVAADNAWKPNPQGNAPIWLQQLYGIVKYRGVFLQAGMRNHTSLLVDDTLSSGDFVLSNNARPIPQVGIGFIDYQNIPLTKGWVQIAGRITYGRFVQNAWLDNHFGYYNSHKVTGAYYTYKNFYLRSNPNKPLCVTIGAQSAGIFGGHACFYSKGRLYNEIQNTATLKDFWNMFIPSLRNGEGFVLGSHLGTWEMNVRYRLAAGHELSAYFQWPWEDGSSMAKRNKWDGLWGIQYRAPSPNAYVRSALIEYIDFRNQSGPMHWAPNDNPGTSITIEATGRDNYYNNAMHNSYANLGMAIGTPFMLSPLYNLDGNLTFLYNRTAGMHAALAGCILPDKVDYMAKVSYQRAWGGVQILDTPRDNTSFIVEASWRDALTRGLAIKASVACDRGRLRGNNVGAMLTISYQGILKIKH